MVTKKERLVEMVNGITGVGTGVSIEDIKAIVTETVEEVLESQAATKTETVETAEADEESGLIEEETTQAETKEDNSLQGFAGLLSAMATMMTTMMQTMMQMLGVKTETDSNVQTGAEDQNTQTDDLPGYDSADILTDAGLAKAYATDEKRKVESTNNSEANRRKELEVQMEADLASIEKALVAEFGDEMTDEIQTYINKARMAVLADSDLITTSSQRHGFLNMHKKTLGEYSVKEVADAFFAEFNKMYTQKD